MIVLFVNKAKNLSLKYNIACHLQSARLKRIIMQKIACAIISLGETVTDIWGVPIEIWTTKTL